MCYRLSRMSRVPRRVAYLFLAFCSIVAVPQMALAQTGTIAGTVKDSSGAVIPGVTVEATSPALIEKVRAVVSDTQGEYKIVDLRPGAYTVTFTLPGFSIVRREGIELTTGITATVDAEMRVGSLEETLTVTGQAPLVDVQNTTQHRAVTRDVMDTIPSGRRAADFAVLTPGVTVAASGGGPTTVGQDVGGSTGDSNQGLAIHGSTSLDMRYIMDGMIAGNTSSTGGTSAGTVNFNNAMIQEIAIDTSGATAEVMNSGVRANVIPKQGGNEFLGFFYGNYTNAALQSTNLDAELAAKGITTTHVFNNLFDINPALGGPLKQDRIWFYGSVRYFGGSVSPPGARYALDPASFRFTPDPNRTPTNDFWTRSADLRVTWQISQRTKVNVFGDYQQRENASAAALSSSQAFEATQSHPIWPRFVQTTWNWTASNRVLVELGHMYFRYVTFYLPQDGFVGAIPIVDSGIGLTYHGSPRHFGVNSNTHSGKASLAYITGSHSFKVGSQVLSGMGRWPFMEPVQYGFVNGVPASILLRATPYIVDSRVKLDFGAYAQDQWTRGRLTMNAGVRFDAINGFAPAQCAPAGLYAPARCIEAIENTPNWKDISPRLGAAYDLSGNGRTAIKWNVGRFVEAQAGGFVQAVNPLSGPNATTTRQWTDLNSDFVPDCDLANPVANGECGRNNNNSFGLPVLSTRYDTDATTGWGTRGYNWETMAGLQHELWPGFSVEASYHRRWFGNLRATVNTAVTPADFDPFCITTPADPRLPGGGNQRICGLYDVKPTRFGLQDSVITRASNYGDLVHAFDGVDVVANVRLPRGILVQGGTSTGRTKFNSCDVVVGHPEIDSLGWLITAAQGTLPHEEAFCDITPPFLTQVKLLGSFPLPWWGLQTGLTLQSERQPIANQGGLEGITALWAVPNAQIAPTLGRNLSSRTNAPVNIVPAGTLYGERLNQLDFRVSKTFAVRGTRIQAQLDVYNLLNENTVLALNNTYGARWQVPSGLLPPRFAKFGVQLNF